MYSPNPRWLLCLVLAVAFPAVVAAELEVEARTVDGQVLVDVRAPLLFDDDLERSLRSGLPARVRLVVELWNERTGLWDHFVLDHRSEIRVLYDVLDARYDVFDGGGVLLASTSERGEAARWVEEVDGLPLCAIEDLHPEDRYYVSAAIRLQPMTVEEVRDLERWLRGSLEGGDGQGSVLGRVSRQLFGVLKGRVGLGDRGLRGRSGDFRAADD